MQAIEIARRMAELGNPEKACEAYSLAIHENNGADPAQDMEAAVFILQSGWNYKTAYTCFVDLYNRGCFQEDCLSIMTEAFYAPNFKEQRTCYQRNCKLLDKYPYLFRKDFPDFDDLPIKFFPFDDKSYVPFDTRENRFGAHIAPRKQVISRNFFKDLEKPILARDVFSQYELEYLVDNVRKSEDIGRENHIYLHYSDWEVFCSCLQCLNMRPLLEERKVVFLIGDEEEQYPIDFKRRFNIDYSQYPVKPLEIRDFKRLIWHTQLSSHNGGDFFNEIFDGHPNLLATPSTMLESVEKSIANIEEALKLPGLRMAQSAIPKMDPEIMAELYHLRDRTQKDILVAMFFNHTEGYQRSLDQASRIAPAVFFQPHFRNLYYEIDVDFSDRVTLYSKEYEKIRTSPLFQNFKYIKTFTPMRRPTTSYGATVKFSYNRTLTTNRDGKRSILNDPILQRLLNRSFMIDWQDRLYMDSVLVRFEDGKLNPKATFTALAAFLDLPYTESMTYCSLKGELNPESLAGNDLGFSTAAIYRTYDDYANDDERYFLEYFMRDVYEYYGYEFKYYDGAPVDEQKVEELIQGFSTIDHYIRDSWQRNVLPTTEVTTEGKAADPAQREGALNMVLENRIAQVNANRLRTAKFLLGNPFFVNKNGQPLHMMPKLELDPALLEQPLYH